MKKQKLHSIDEKWNHVPNKLPVIVLTASIVLLEKMSINESELMMG